MKKGGGEALVITHPTSIGEEGFGGTGEICTITVLVVHDGTEGHESKNLKNHSSCATESASQSFSKCIAKVELEILLATEKTDKDRCLHRYFL